MAGGTLVQLWNEWAIQILILLSFAMQIFLFLFAGKRRRGSSDILMNLLWLGYLMADTTAVYTVGHLSISGSLQEHKLLVFWAPFLLVHLGSQDTITAYSLEDNQLWPRHLLNLGVQAFGVAYVLYKHIADIAATLGLATCLMFIVGVIKYGERIRALKRATLDNVQAGLHEHNFQSLSNYYPALVPQGPGTEEHDEEELLLFAQAVLPLCKGAMTDYPMLLADNSNLNTGFLCGIWGKWNWKAMCKLVEMELSLMYDILYTKSTVIHTWYGYCIRFFSPLATIVAFVLFQLSANKYGYNNRVDVAITYILLVGAFLLDMVSVFTAVISTWTCHLLWDKEWTKLGRVILSLRRHIKAAGVNNNRGWSGYVRQFNLLHFCSRDRKRLGIQVAKRMGLVDWWNKWYYSKAIVLSVDVKELLFKCVWKVLVEIHDPPSAEDGIMSVPPYEVILEEEPIAVMMPDQNLKLYCLPESYKDTASRRLKLAQALDFGCNLQEAILTWHICTDVFLLCSDTPKDARSSTYIKAIKAVSNYMVFLIRPGTITGLELRSMYEGTRADLEKTWYPVSGSASATREKMLASKLMRNYTGSMIILRHGSFYAKLLVQLVGRNPDIESCSSIISSYTEFDSAAMDKLKCLMPRLELSWEADGVFNMSKALALILDTWVRLLILASSRCRRDAHARHINCGGELSTIVWLMEEHASMFFQREPGVVMDEPIILSPDIGEAAVCCK